MFCTASSFARERFFFLEITSGHRNAATKRAVVIGGGNVNPLRSIERTVCTFSLFANALMENALLDWYVRDGFERPFSGFYKSIDYRFFSVHVQYVSIYFRFYFGRHFFHDIQINYDCLFYGTREPCESHGTRDWFRTLIART